MPAAGSGLPFADLCEKIARGIAWLVEHDPTGAFHLWFTSKITSTSPLPAQDEARRADYAAYYKQRVIWESLWHEMERRELEGEGPATAFAGPMADALLEALPQ